jgi:hypothetical protein
MNPFCYFVKNPISDPVKYPFFTFQNHDLLLSDNEGASYLFKKVGC